MMPNPEIVNQDSFFPFIARGPARDDTATFGGAATWKAGTILARDSVSGFLVPFVKGGVTNENGIPKIVLHEDLVQTGAGDFPVRVYQSGSTIKNRLIILADGDDQNVDAAVIDQLRNYILTAKDHKQLSAQDDQ